MQCRVQKNWLTSKLQGNHTFHSKKLRSWWRLMSCQMSENEKLFRRKWADRSFAHEIFCWQLKNYELILTSGPWTRTSEVRYSHVRAPNDPCVPPPSCHFVSTRSGRWISQVFNQKMKRNMEICMTAPLLVFDLLQENPLWRRQGFLIQLKCPASVVYNKGWG